MIDIKDKEYCPTLEEIGEFINNAVFLQFCAEVQAKYNCKETIEFSSCSWEYGWNVKFKKSGKSLCTIYPREGFFTVLIVIGEKEREAAETILYECTPGLRAIYDQTNTGNGQKWLMIDLEDRKEMYTDILRLITVRNPARKKGGKAISLPAFFL